MGLVIGAEPVSSLLLHETLTHCPEPVQCTPILGVLIIMKPHGHRLSMRLVMAMVDVLEHKQAAKRPFVIRWRSAW